MQATSSINASTTALGKPISVAAKSHSDHIPALDGIRGLAILAVMIFHQTILTSDTLADRLFRRVAESGWCGVDLFFVLSGFLITGILLEAKGSAHYLRNFYARRVLRIFPLYYGVLIFSVCLLPLIPHPKAANFGRIAGEEVWYFAYLQNYVMAWRPMMDRGPFQHGILDVTWSLAIEEQFYIVWPFVILLLRPRALMRVCLVIVAVSLILRVAAFAKGLPAVSVYVATPTRLDGLAAGAFCATAIREYGGVRTLLPGCRIIAFLAGLALLGVWLAPDGYSYESPLTATIGYTLLALCFSAGLLLAVGADPGTLIHAALTGRLLRAFGKYSYAMYLFHLPLRALLRDTIFGSNRFPSLAGSQLPGQLVFYIVSTALTFLAGWLSWNLFEKQILKLKKLFPRQETRYEVVPEFVTCPAVGQAGG
jgi:peptidoglycan/LPS O-acetylase OafA/YrhL